ncbi:MULTISPECIES: ABC transporter ATP-binding protein [Aneurinibacillus]|uniref:ABC transporter ATP-binding protein n=1 Tax=Aneurinibacillus thermoaerophilus TaxID=143495 RepID=A0A1G7WZX4_ANETH|nr:MULTISPECIES: ABC transporter ATP-binding protein [Aneurinibacillus]AMA73855.1 ABC transporter ATP-binding protein [Aneurinibacillus sp. XH2]MED0674029.1 ABC transporter ATP-binding protein [Aneurinibacillus thermoaerophilus]MED0678016.1 ABC transporter ATP-binding protein [Aneurinibacillus thermoaerophilus]MED0737794.1 ABC transporter ATP-binding protein [Aneurinibacillus thermoaerophilus]MED0755782.1 ABC transporter ATP-binding protein [Aneurinibacillus thermoaerophilus]
MLEVTNLHTYHGYLHVLRGIHFSLQKGETLAIVGSNGAGKSTLLGTLAGIYAPQAGNIVFEGEDISELRAEQVVAKGIALVPERRQIFDSLSVKDNLILGSYHRFRRDRQQVLRDYEKMLHFFPRLQSMLDRPSGLLSGGEQQMLAIARGLMANPKLLMLDEPSLGLAPLIVKSIMEILQQLKQEFGTTIILVEQNVRAALGIADYACVLERGQIVISGAAQEVAENPAVRDAYLGKGKKAM